MKNIVFVILILLIAGCAMNPHRQKGENEAHATTLPAVVFCFFAVCESQFSDRAERAFVDKSSNDSDADLGANVEKPVTTKRGLLKK